MTVMVQRVHCCQYAGVTQHDLPQPLARWLAKHGIDPDLMFTPGNIWACDLSRQIDFDARTDEHGVVALNDYGEPLVSRRSVQLEAPPLPMPAINTGLRRTRGV